MSNDKHQQERFIEVSIDAKEKVPDENSSPVSLKSLEMLKLPWYKSKRHLIPLLCFLAVFVMYIVRFSFSQASIPMSQIYDWSQFDLSSIVSSFYVGYLPSQLIGAFTSKIWGGKPVVAIGLLLSCVGSVCIPILASYYSLMLVLRIIMGVGQGLMYPAMCELLSQWVIPQEKSLWLNFSWSGGQVGTIFCLGIYPTLNELFGWKFPFFAFGTGGLLWFYFWNSYVWETPEKHPSLSSKEKYILETYPPRGKTSKSTLEKNSSKRGIPWLSILLTWQIYPIMLIYFGYNWSFYLMINSLPTYLEMVLGFRSSMQGLLSMLPYIFLWITLIVSGILSNWMIQKKIPIWVQRKGMVFVGLLPSALVLLFLSSFSNSVFWTLAAINFVIAMPGFSMSGFSPAAFDLSSEYAAAVTSICYVFGALPGIICPLVTGLILDQAKCRIGSNGGAAVSLECKEAWFLAFRIGGVIYAVTALVWAFASFKPVSFSK